MSETTPALTLDELLIQASVCLRVLGSLRDTEKTASIAANAAQAELLDVQEQVRDAELSYLSAKQALAGALK